MWLRILMSLVRPSRSCSRRDKGSACWEPETGADNVAQLKSARCAARPHSLLGVGFLVVRWRFTEYAFKFGGFAVDRKG